MTSKKHEKYSQAMVALCAAAGLALTGCSDSAADPTSSTSPATTESAETQGTTETEPTNEEKPSAEGDPTTGSTPTKEASSSASAEPMGEAPEDDPGTVEDAVALPGNYNANREAAPKRADGSVDCAQAACIALTFDDGPARTSSQIIRTLEKTGVPATFFAIGQQVPGSADLLERSTRTGNVYGNHSWNHPDLRKVTPGQRTKEIADTDKALRDATGVTPQLLRPPYGASNDAVRQSATDAGKVVVMWNVDTLDWQHRDTNETIRRATTDVHRGDIILMHDIHQPTANALPSIITTLEAQGYTLVSVPELIGNPDQYVGKTVFSQYDIR